jgi:hypothetical protein
MTSKLPTYRLAAVDRDGGYVRMRFYYVGNGRSYFVDLTDDDFAEMLAKLRTVAGDATPSEENEIDAVVPALAALTDRVRALEEWAKPQSSAPLDFGDDGKLYVSPAVIPKVRAAEQSIADEATEPVSSASKLYDEITRITTEPTVNLLARIDALECELAIMRTRFAGLEDTTARHRR